MQRIERSDLEAPLREGAGQQALTAALRRIRTGEELVAMLGSFIHFNSIFGGCVANLAGEIAVRQDLFRSREEPVAMLADRSADVAAAIFFAAVDEFDDRVTRHRDTHRSLAQATLKGVAAYLGFDDDALNALTQPSPALLEALRNVREGYGVNQPVSDEALFRGIGFHLGSELLADAEFNAWNHFLRTEHAPLVAHLEAIRVRIDDTEHAPYFWIKVHTSVEVDHFDSAVRGADLALSTYAGAAGPAVARGWILEGFRRFAEVQTAYLTHLLPSVDPAAAGAA